MAVSSTSMNAASETTAAISHGLTLRFAGVDEPYGSKVFGAAAIASPERLRVTSHPHGRLHRHSRAQPMVRVLARVEANPHRQALNDLDIVAGRVFGRQQAVELARRAGYTLDVAVVVAPCSIDVNLDGLAATHLTQLRLAEVSGGPDIIERNDGKQLLAWLHALADLHSLVVDHSGGGRDDMRITQIERGLIQRSLRRLDRGLGLADHLRRGSDFRAVRVDDGRIDSAGHDDFVVGLLWNHGLVKQLTVTLHIQLRLEVRCDRRVKIGNGQLVVLLRRFHALLGLGEVGLGVFHRDLVVARVEIDQRLAVFYSIGV